LIATEPTGAYLAVVNSVGLNPGESSVESFQINATAGALVPVSGSFLVSTSTGAAGNPALGTFYVYLGPNPLSSNPFYLQDGELLIYTIDALTGLLGNETGSAGSTMAALLIFVPLILAADGCGGGSTIAPTAQKTSVVTPSGTSTLVITPTATNASGKALQLPLIQLTLVVN
jgi:hypothetical protein